MSGQGNAVAMEVLGPAEELLDTAPAPLSRASERRRMKGLGAIVGFFAMPATIAATNASDPLTQGFAIFLAIILHAIPLSVLRRHWQMRDSPARMRESREDTDDFCKFFLLLEFLTLVGALVVAFTLPVASHTPLISATCN